MTDTRLTLSDVKGLFKDLNDKLCGEDWREWLYALKHFLRKENPWGDVLPDLDWVRTYEELGIAFDPNILPAVDPVYWHIPVLKGVTPNKVVETLRRLGVNMYLYTEDLDADVSTNDRAPQGNSYVISVKRRAKADEENKNLSANDLKEQNVPGTTLLERLLLGLAYYVTTGQHLDIECWTLCSGSRGSGGRVPSVYWSPYYRGVCVGWYSPDGRNGSMRARTAVSIPTP